MDALVRPFSTRNHSDEGVQVTFFNRLLAAGVNHGGQGPDVNEPRSGGRSKAIRLATTLPPLRGSRREDNLLYGLTPNGTHFGV